MKSPLIYTAILGLACGFVVGFWTAKKIKPRIFEDNGSIKLVRAIPTINPKLEEGIEKIATPAAVVASAAATASQSALSFDELNKTVGPCVKLPVMMFHHIEEEADAKVKGQTGLNVTPEYFRKDMEYLKTHGYTTIFLNQLADFFNTKTPLPKKAVAITLDDGYQDNYQKMYPILKEYGFRATIFTPTGLLQNPDYLTWQNIAEMSSSGLVYFANHTWSHHPSSGSVATQDKEISLANTQLSDHGQDPNKIFAYPYGNPSKDAEIVLAKYNFQLAFTTRHGSIMCKGQKYELPRIRIGNAPLSSYGF